MDFAAFVNEWIPQHSQVDKLVGVVLYVDAFGVITDLVWIDESKISRTESIYRHVFHDKFRDPIPYVLGVHPYKSDTLEVFVANHYVE